MPEDKPAPEGHKTPQEELVFYYSRSRRLERASEAVRELNESGPPRGKGPFKTLSAPRSGTMLFVSIVLVLVFIMVFSYRQSQEGGHRLGENDITVSALRFSGSTYIAVKKTARNEGAYTGTVDMAVSENTGGEAPISTQRIFFTLEPEEDFRISIPFEAAELLILMQAGEELIRMRVKPE